MVLGKKIALAAVAVVAFLLLLLTLIIPRIINLDRHRPGVVATLQARTGKPVRIGHLALTLFPVIGVDVKDFGLGNPADFPPGDLIRASRIRGEVSARELWHHRILIRSLDINKPAIHLMSHQGGKWNYQTAASASPRGLTASTTGRAFSLSAINQIRVDGGELIVTNLPGSGQQSNSVEIQAFSTRLDNVVPSRFLKATAPDERGVSNTPVSSDDSGAAGANTTAVGALDAKTVRLGKLLLTNLKSKLQLYPQQVLLHDISFNLCQGQGSGTVSLNFAPPEIIYVAEVKFQAIDVATLLASFPDGRGKLTGKMEGQINLSGHSMNSSPSSDSLAGKRGTGELIVRNGQLPTLQIKKSLLELAKLINVGPPTGDPSSFSSLTTDLEIANSRITSHSLKLSGNGIEIDASGGLRLAAEGNLDYQGIAKVAAGENAITSILAGFSGATFEGGTLLFPFTLQGTPQHPVFRVKSSRSVGSALIPKSGTAASGSSPDRELQNRKALQSLRGLFRKRTH